MLIGIVGAGVMGSGIAQSFVMEKGNQVTLSDVDIEFAKGKLGRKTGSGVYEYKK